MPSFSYEDAAAPAQPSGPSSFSYEEASGTPAKPRGFLPYIAQQAKAGLSSDLPTIAGKALQYAGATDIGGKIRAYGEANAAENQPDPNQGPVTQAVASALRGAAPIVPLAVGGLLAQGTPVGPALDIAGAAALAGGFGGSQAQDTFEKAKAAGKSDEEARSIANKTGAITGVGMGLVGAATGGVAAPAFRSLAGTGAKTAADVIASEAAPTFVRPFVADTAGHLAGNVASMAAANAATAGVEKDAGLPGPTPGEAAMEGVSSGAGLTAALLPFGAARSMLAQRANAAAVARLQSPQTDPAQRAQVANRIQANLQAVDPDAAENFSQHAIQAISNAQPLELGAHLLEPPTEGQYQPPAAAAPLALPAPVVRVDQQGNAQMDGVTPPVQDEGAANVVGRAPIEPAPAEPAPLALPAPTMTVDSNGHVLTAADRTAARGMRETGAMGLGRNSDVTDVTAREPTPAEKMGIDATAGPISNAAAIAVDSGAHKTNAAAAEATGSYPNGIEAQRALKATGQPGKVVRADGAWRIQLDNPEAANAKKAGTDKAGSQTAAAVGSAKPGKAVSPAGAAAENAQAAGLRPFPPTVGSLGVPRAEMPQITPTTHGPLTQFLAARGITHEVADADPRSLKPAQGEYDPAKVREQQGNDASRTVLTSSDGYILDGTHQWLSRYAAGEPIKTIRFDAPIKDLLPLAKEFPSAKTAEEQAQAAPADKAGAAGPSSAAAEPAGNRAAAPAAEKPAAALTPRTGEGTASVLAAMQKQRQEKLAPAPVQREATAAAAAAPRARESSVLPSDILNDQGAPFRNRMAAGAALKKAGAGHEVAPLAEGGFVVRALPKTETAPAEPKALHVGITPGNAEPVTVKDGIVHVGKDQAINFDSGEPVKVKVGASDAEVKQALKDAGALSRRQKFFGGEQEAPDNKMRIGAPKGAAGGRTARSVAYEKNPLRAFIAEHGLAPELAQEFAPGIRERRAAMVPGYGPIFRKGGLQMDKLAERAEQDGYLPKGNTDANRLYDLVARAMRGERIIPQYAEGAVEKEAQKHIEAHRELDDLMPHDLDHEGYDRASEQLQGRVREIMAGLSDAQRESVLEDVAKRTENATDDEYLAAVRKATEAALASAGEPSAQDRGGPAGKAGAEPAQQGKAEGLTAPTRAEVLAAEARKESAPALDAKAAIDREAEKQTLTQPVAPEQRKDTTGDLLGNAYDEARATAAEASKKFSAIRQDYRDKKIGDAEFLAARAEFDKANKAFDAAETKFIADTNAAEAARKRQPKPKDDGGTVPMFSRRKAITNTDEFRKWFGKSKVVDEKGKPIRVYHGTTGDFSTFDPSRGNIESDFGAGLYFSNTPEDVASNYAGEGPDLTSKIEREAERIASETDRDYKDPEVIAEAKESLGVEHGGATMPVYLKMEKPAILGGKKETRLSMEIDDDGNESGTLAEFIGDLRQVASRFDDGDIDAGVEAVLSAADYSDITLRQAIDELKNAEGFGYFTDENGNLASHEIIRQTLARMGYDGIIDHTVDEKFGSQRRIGKQMSGMREDTVHYIVFEPEQVKSATGNNGEFNPNNPDIRYRRDNTETEGAPLRVSEIRKAIAPALDSLKVPYELHSSIGEARDASGLGNIPAGVKGMYYGGKLHLVAEGIKSPLEAEQVLWHEVNHAGIDKIYGSSKNTEAYYNAMRDMARQNANIREAAKEWLRDFGADDTKARIAAGMTRDIAETRTKLQAVEEALSNLAGKNAQINGATRFIAKVQELMRAVGLNRLADSLEKMTDAQALSMIFKAREAVMKEPQAERGQQLAPAFSKDNASMSREKQTVSEAFRKWFGGSKVVDEKGEPQVVYHGTNAKFDAFDQAQNGKAQEIRGQVPGSWFAADQKVAGYFGENKMPVYLSLKNPFRIGAADYLQRFMYNGEDPAKFRAKLEAKGHDGLIIEAEPEYEGGRGPSGTEEWGQTNYVAFKPEQIKSATGNRGTFDPNSANISFSRTLDKISDRIDAIKGAAVTKDVGTAYDGLLMATNPAARSDAAKEMARTLVAGMGEKEMKSIQFRVKLNAAIQETAKATTLSGKARDLMERGLTTQADKVFLRNKPEDNHAFMQAMDTGDEKFFEAHPELKPMADVISRMFDEKAKEIQGLGTGALQAIRENYFPHIWNREPSGDKQREIFSTLAKRALEGRKGFTKERIFDDVQAGLDAGFEPISNNPLDIVALKMEEMDKYILAHKTLQAMEGSNGVHLIAAGEKTPQGFTDVNGRFGSIERNGEKLRYVARDDVAQVINNYLSPSLYHNKYVGKPFTAYMGAANTLNQFQLGVFSAFHAGFTSMEAVISHAAIGVKAFTAGDFKGAAHYLGTAPAAWINNPKMGSKIIAHMMDSAAHPEMAPILEGLQLAGFKWQMDPRFRTDATKNMLQAWQDGKKFKAGLNSIGAVAEQTARPILEWLVPRQKFGVFGEMYSKWMQDNPNASHEELRNSAQQIWNRVDSRLGQVVYDRLFVHNVAKNFAQMLIRAPGWTGGTILEVGGGLKDLVGYAKALATGQKPPSISDRAAYTLSMLMVTAMANAAMTAMFTGDSPQDWRDLVAFRTGNMDEHGRPERFMLPTYMKDVYAYAKAPGTTLINKSHPLLSLVGDIGKNKDFYGTEIRSEDANILTQLAQTAGFAAKAFVPFWMKGVQKEQEREGSALSMAAPLVGVMPAPSDLNKTAAEKLMTQYGADKMPQGSRTQEETQKADLRRQMLLALRKGEQDKAKELFDQGKEQGLFGPRDYLKVMRQARQDPLASQFSHLTFDQAQRVMKVATDAEKQELAPLFMRKRIADQRQHVSAGLSE
jgi:hypothetical protein